MTKWTKTGRDPGRTYQDEREAKQLRDDMKRVAELVAEAAEETMKLNSLMSGSLIGWSQQWGTRKGRN